MLVNITRYYSLLQKQSLTFFVERKVVIAIFQLDGFVLMSLINEIAAFRLSWELSVLSVS